MKESKSALRFGLGAGFLGVLCCMGPLIPILKAKIHDQYTLKMEE